jgi:hypothetical protein
MQRRVLFQQSLFRAGTVVVCLPLSGYRPIRHSATIPRNLT